MIRYERGNDHPEDGHTHLRLALMERPVDRYDPNTGAAIRGVPKTIDEVHKKSNTWKRGWRQSLKGHALVRWVSIGECGYADERCPKYESAPPTT